jgi:NAD dependent epimerase/dehydratase family enzyme
MEKRAGPSGPVSNDRLNGAANATTPTSVRNADFARALGKALHRPAVFRLPAWLISTALGDMGRETMLGGQRVVPAKLTDGGFVFRHPELEPMLREITGSRAGFAGRVDHAIRKAVRSRQETGEL